MSHQVALYLIVGAGAASTATLLVLALISGRRPADRRGPWIAALILAGLPAAFLGLAAVVTAVTGSFDWMQIGAVGLCCLFALSFIRPRWAGWTFIASGLAFPLLLWLADTFLTETQLGSIGVGQALGFYAWRALLTGGLLLWAVTPRRDTSHPPFVPDTGTNGKIQDE